MDDMKTGLTNFMPIVNETDETSETYISSEEFLLTLFGNELGDARPFVVSFEESPNTVQSKAWFGRSWSKNSGQDSKLPANANNYFSFAVFLPDEKGRYRRQKVRFHALYVVVLDDVGSKVPIERLGLRASWLLETSPGNFQAGYILRVPLEDGIIADKLVKAIIKAGLTDPGANGPCTRLARLPIAVNSKHSPPFACRMASWAPELRYSVQELVDGLKLDMSETKQPGREQTLPDDGDSVWMPRPLKNPVLDALRQRSLYKSLLGAGKHNIICPWVIEHTNAVESGTAYFEPGENWPLGGFKCMHGHCAGRHIRELLRVLDVEVNAARMKPTIRIIAGEIHRVVDAAEQELAQSQQHFQRGSIIVSVVIDPGTHEARVQEVSTPALVRALAGLAIWERFDARSEKWKRADPPTRHVTVLSDAARYPHLPVLSGLARQPFLRPDGSMMVAAGYDPATHMFGVFDPQAFSIPENPSKADAERALAMLQELLAEFSFEEASDRAAALAGLLTAAIRPSLALAPMFHVRAHMVGSGKSYLCALMTAFATPQPGTPTTFPSDDDECRKLLLAELLRAPAVMEFDNLTSDLFAHKSLCTALTSEFLAGRILGASKTATVSTRVLLLSSGNNVGPVQDMTRRCITIRLNPGMEVPATRTFTRPDLVSDLLREREHYVSAALTIVRSWIAAGRPKIVSRSLASYGEWSDLCCQPLLWLGCADPTDSVFEAITEDPDRETLARLLATWQAVFGTTAAMVRDAMRQSNLADSENVELREVLHDIAEERGDINRLKLGRWIKRHAGRIVGGLRFVRASGSSSAVLWRVESVSSVL